MGLVMAALAAGLGVSWAQPPEAGDSNTPVREFSSARAMADVEALAAQVRPVESAGHRWARQYLVSRLEVLGLEVEVQVATVAMERRPGSYGAGRVRNILARRRGTGAAGAVLLLAHYDSRAQTFGAGDDAAGLATILETLRALGPEQTQRDILVVMSDAEEFDLFGARAFVEQHRWRQEVEFVINLDARGNSGPSLMYETTLGNLELIRALAAAVPYPFANSLSYEVYRRMPNDSDLTPFRETSAAGFNFAFIGNHPAYHSRLDSAERLDQRSLQHHGANVLALARHLANVDRRERSGENAVYFSVLPWRLIVYPASTAPMLGVGLLLMTGAALLRSRRSGVWTPGGLARGVMLVLAGVAGAYLIGLVFWWFLQMVAPALLEAPHGRPYRMLWFGAAIALLVGALLAVLVRWLQIGERSLELLAGALIFWTAGALALSFWIPGASFLLTWPACSAWIAWWIVARVGKGEAVGMALVVTALGAVPGVLLFAPLLVLFLEALTLSGAGVPAGLLGLLLTLLAPQIPVISPRLPHLLAGAAVALVLLTAALSSRTAERPRTDTLFYATSDEGSYWYSLDARTDSWTEAFLGDEPERLTAPRELIIGSRPVIRTPAPEVGLARPWVKVGEVKEAKARRISVTVGSENGGQVIHVRATSKAPFEAVWVEGTRFEIENAIEDIFVGLVGSSSESEPWSLGFLVAGSESLELDILEQRWGLPDLVGFSAKRPLELIPDSTWRTDSTFVHRRLSL